MVTLGVANERHSFPFSSRAVDILSLELLEVTVVNGGEMFGWERNRGAHLAKSNTVLGFDDVARAYKDIIII